MSHLNFRWISWIDNLEEQNLLSFSSLHSSVGLQLKILRPFVALRGGDDEVFTRSVLWSWTSYTINPTNKTQLNYLTQGWKDIQQAFTDWKTWKMCLGCTCAACCVTFSFDNILDGPCCLESFPFLPREVVGEPSSSVCIMSPAIDKCMLHVSLTQRDQLLFLSSGLRVGARWESVLVSPVFRHGAQGRKGWDGMLWIPLWKVESWDDLWLWLPETQKEVKTIV